MVESKRFLRPLKVHSKVIEVDSWNSELASAVCVFIPSTFSKASLQDYKLDVAKMSLKQQ